MHKEAFKYYFKWEWYAASNSSSTLTGVFVDTEMLSMYTN